MVHWLERLSTKGLLTWGSSMLEFGPQDVNTPKAVVRAAATRLLGEQEADRRLDLIYDGESTRRTCQADLYGLFGIEEYRSLDPFDDRADYHYDLGWYVPIFRRFDVITNFGTSEHVCKLENVFRTAYRLLRPGGLLLNVSPTHGDIDHGFYNIHPILFRMLAKHSGFEICDFHFIDDIGLRTDRQNTMPDAVFDFDMLPIKHEHMEDEHGFKAMVYRTFLSNAALRSSKLLGNDYNAPPVFDYNFVALRKLPGTRFKPPYQYVSEAPSSWVNLRLAMAGGKRRSIASFAKSGAEYGPSSARR